MAGEWRECTIGELCDEGVVDLQTGPFGTQLHAHDYVDGGVPVVPTEAIRNRQIDHSVLPKISPGKAEELARHRLELGDILFARRGVQATGHIGCVREAEDGFLCGTGAIRLRVRRGGSSVNPDFLSHVLANPASVEWFKFHAIGATMPNLNEGIIRSFPLQVPPLPEQRAIAHILGTLDDKIELNRLMNETLEGIARTLFKSWFIDFEPVRAKVVGRDHGLPQNLADLFPDSFEDSELGEIPRGWKLRTIGDLSEQVAMGPFGSSIKVSTFVSEGVPVISGQHLRETLVEDSEFNFITEAHADQLKRSNVQRGDVIFTHAGSIGQVAYITDSSRYKRYIISQRQFYMRCNPKKMSPLFIVSYFKTPIGQHRLLANTSSTGVPSISQPVSYLRHLQIVIPPHDLLSIFDSAARAIYHAVAQNKNQSRTLANLRDTLLPRLISGELRIKGSEQSVGRVV